MRMNKSLGYARVNIPGLALNKPIEDVYGLIEERLGYYDTNSAMSTGQLTNNGPQT